MKNCKAVLFAKPQILLNEDDQLAPGLRVVSEENSGGYLTVQQRVLQRKSKLGAGDGEMFQLRCNWKEEKGGYSKPVDKHF